MIRGTTPTFTLNMLDEQLDLRNASNVYATFKQNKVLLTKTGNDLNITVTQESGSQNRPKSLPVTLRAESRY